MSVNMFSSPLRRVLLQPSSHLAHLPPTFLLPLRARLTTSTTTTDPNPPESAFTTLPTNETPTSTITPPPSPPSLPKPHRLTRRSPLPAPTNPNLELLPHLAAQPPHYITAHLHARPYLLTDGDTLRLPFHLPNAPPGTTLRLNRASTIGSRDYTFRGAPWIDEDLFVLRARVVGVEGEPMRIVKKTKRRQRKVKGVKSKMRFTILRVCELRVLPWGRMVGEEEEGAEAVEEFMRR